MMKTTNMTVRLDSNLKRDAEKVFSELGLSFTDAIRVFVTKVVREERIPFELKIDPFYSKENQVELLRRIRAIEAGEKPKVRELIDPDKHEKSMV